MPRRGRYGTVDRRRRVRAHRARGTDRRLDAAKTGAYGAGRRAAAAECDRPRAVRSDPAVPADFARRRLGVRRAAAVARHRDFRDRATAVLPIDAARRSRERHEPVLSRARRYHADGRRVARQPARAARPRRHGGDRGRARAGVPHAGRPHTARPRVTGRKPPRPRGCGGLYRTHTTSARRTKGTGKTCARHSSCLRERRGVPPVSCRLLMVRIAKNAARLPILELSAPARKRVGTILEMPGMGLEHARAPADYGDTHDDLLHDRRFHPVDSDGACRSAIPRRGAVRNPVPSQPAARARCHSWRRCRGAAGRRAARADLAQRRRVPAGIRHVAAPQRRDGSHARIAIRHPMVRMPYRPSWLPIRSPDRWTAFPTD
ncbi:hypothetical protein BLAT2472_120076 [Burkholderia latens]